MRGITLFIMGFATAVLFISSAAATDSLTVALPDTIRIDEGEEIVLLALEIVDSGRFAPEEMTLRASLSDTAWAWEPIEGSNNGIRVRPRDPDANGIFQLILTCAAPDGTAASDSTIVVVAPVIDLKFPRPIIIILEVRNTASYDLMSAVADRPPGEIQFKASGAPYLQVELEGSALTITARDDSMFLGKQWIDVQAKDESGHVVRGRLEVVVKPRRIFPTFADSAAFVGEEDTPIRIHPSMIVKRIPEHSDMSLADIELRMRSPSGDLTASYDAAEDSLEISVPEDVAGNYTVILEACWEDFPFDSTFVLLTYIERLDVEIPDSLVTLYQGSERTWDPKNFLSGIDPDSVKFSLWTSGSDKIETWLDEGGLWHIQAKTGAVGTEKVGLLATGPDGYTEGDTVLVSVEAPHKVVLTDLFFEIWDSSVQRIWLPNLVEYSVSAKVNLHVEISHISDPVLFNATIEGRHLVITTFGTLGVGEVTIKVEDPLTRSEAKARVRFDIVLRPIIQVPAIHVPYESSLSLNLSDYVRNAGRELNYSAYTSGRSRIRVDKGTGETTISAPMDWFGTERVKFRIADRKNLQLRISSSTLIVVDPPYAFERLSEDLEVLSPSDGVVDADSGYIHFRGIGSLAERDVWISHDPTFMLDVTNIDSLFPQGNRLPAHALLDMGFSQNTAYWMQIVLIRQVGGQLRSTRRFRFILGRRPKPVQLISPQETVLRSGREVPFRWRRALDDGAKLYQLSVWPLDSMFVFQAQVRPLPMETQKYTLNERELPDGYYGWQITAVSPLGLERTSGAAYFEIFDLHVLSPPDSAIFEEGIKVSFSWGGVRVAYGRNPDFVRLLITNRQGEPSLIEVEGASSSWQTELPEGRYHWKLQVLGPEGEVIQESQERLFWVGRKRITTFFAAPHPVEGDDPIHFLFSLGQPAAHLHLFVYTAQGYPLTTIKLDPASGSFFWDRRLSTERLVGTAVARLVAQFPDGSKAERFFTLFIIP